MTRDELVNRLAKDCEQPEDVVGDLLQALSDLVGVELRAGRRAMIPGLVTLEATFRGRLGVPQVRVTCIATRELAAQLQVLAEGKTAVPKPVARQRKS